MPSKTAVCNQALLHLKNSKLITDVDSDNSVQSNIFLSFWDDAVAEVLEEFEWPFAKRSVALALVEEFDADDESEWTFSYRWPADCSVPRYIYDGNLQPSSQSPRIPFEEGADDTGRLIFTDQEDARLVYTKVIDDVTVMSAKLRSALSYKLAYKAAPTLCGDDRAGLGARAQANYELEISRAKAQYLNERERGTPLESEFIEGR
jgi:hypothetical protein